MNTIKCALEAGGIGIWKCWFYRVNPLIPNINIHILLTILLLFCDKTFDHW